MTRRPTVPAILCAVFISACIRGPAPVVVPPTPSSVRISDLQQTVNGLLAKTEVSHGTWGIVVKSLARDETLVSLNRGRLLTPASSLKVVTLAVAADELGWDYAYHTKLLTTGEVKAGVLDGDLVVVGSGDPSIDDWDGYATGLFSGWARALDAAGIQAVSGKLIGDDNAFEDDGLGAGWAWDDLGSSYAASVGALQFNENTAPVLVTAGSAVAEPATLAAWPAAGLSLRNRVTTTAEGTRASVQMRPVPRTNILELRGTIPIGGQPISLNASVTNPTLYFAGAARDALVNGGIDIVGPALDIDDLPAAISLDGATAVTESLSPPLPKMAATMLKLSQNLYAETLLKTIGMKASGVGSTDAGTSEAQKHLASWGIPANELQMVDGSGLSRYNLVTPDTLVAVLGHVYRDERLRGPFLEALPVAGVDGTLGERMKGTAAAGNARAKTGSLSNARALTGFVNTADREPLAFAILANNYGTDSGAVERVMDAIVVALAQFSRR